MGGSRFASVIESLTPVLESQRAHAAEREQHHRVDLFDMLIERARTEEP